MLPQEVMNQVHNFMTISSFSNPSLNTQAHPLLWFILCYRHNHSHRQAPLWNPATRTLAIWILHIVTQTRKKSTARNFAANGFFSGLSTSIRIVIDSLFMNDGDVKPCSWCWSILIVACDYVVGGSCSVYGGVYEASFQKATPSFLWSCFKNSLGAKKYDRVFKQIN